ncbi:MAG TPA: hypothetical protein VMB51_16405 [Solirubrobacteraceae bacterium]|nr:hypothetical protein [Solirubrobacteraceae bacterium]
MRHVRMLGLCLVAVLAVCAYAVSSASALPEFGKCEAKAGGKYKDANCTEKAKKGEGAYEWKKGSTLKNVKFSGHNVGSGGVLVSGIRSCVLESGAHQSTRKKCKELGGEEVETSPSEAQRIECTSENNHGEISGKKSLKNIDVEFNGCALFGTAPCSNGPNSGQITVNPLVGEIGYINKSEKNVGVKLTPTAKHGEFAKFDCAGILEIIVGVGNSKQGAYYEPESKGGNDGIISPITPVNTMSTKYTQVYTVNPETESNVPSSFQGKPIDLLETYLYNPEEPETQTDWAPAGEEITNTNTSEEAGEIKA